MTKELLTNTQSKAVLDRFPLELEFSRQADRFGELLQSAKHILISSTLTSDGDSVGAQLGILNLIHNLRRNKPVKVTLVNESPVPHRYAFLEHSDQIMSWSDWKATSAPRDFDLGIVLDGGTERTGSPRELFDNLPSVLVDHHAVGSRLVYASKLLDLEASSTCEIVYSLFEHFGVPVSAKAAEAIYVGMIFDTGFFKHSLTRPKTHVVAAELIATGINFSEIADRAILERSWSGQLLLRKLLQNMQRSNCGRVIHSAWSQSELTEIQFKDGDQEGMINQMYYTDTAQVVALFVEHSPTQVKISFRSKGAMNVAEFARSLNPDGGGHIRASGCTLDGSLSQVRQQVVEKLIQALS